MKYLIRLFLKVFCDAKKFVAGSGLNDGFEEVLNEDDRGQTFCLKPFVFVGDRSKAMLNEGDVICRWRGKKFVVRGRFW